MSLSVRGVITENCVGTIRGTKIKQLLQSDTDCIIIWFSSVMAQVDIKGTVYNISCEYVKEIKA